MKAVYEIRNLGRGKWCGEVTAQSDEREHVEAALMKAAEQHLMSRGIDFDGNAESGFFVVGGFRRVGSYRKKSEGEIYFEDKQPYPGTVSNIVTEKTWRAKP